MHSSRMHNAHSLIVSRCISCLYPLCHTCPPPSSRMPPLPCTPPFVMHAPCCHAYPYLPCMAPLSPCMPFPFAMHAPLYHTCLPLPCIPPSPHIPPFTMHVPLCHVCPTSNHACPPCGQADTCKNITVANFVCER